VYEGNRHISTTSTRQYPALATETSAAQAATDVLARAGAYAVAGGTATVRRDSIDQRAVNDFNNGTGTFDTCTGPGEGPCEDAFGGYPTYANGTPYTDTDGDGIADAWETAHGLNPNNAADGPALATNGYSNLENFINELAGDGAPLGPPPAVSLIATPPSITVGNASTLSWTSTDVISCSAPWTSSTATAGSQSVSPTTTTTYTITCTDGTTPVTSNTTVTVTEPQLAFPTAEGFGRFAKGGRGGHAYHINVVNAGLGSGGSCNAGGCGGSPPFSAGTVTFVDCLADRFGVGARTCIFRVGGVFDNPGGYNVPAPGGVGGFITIAGQTAPGSGVMFKNFTLHFTTAAPGSYATDIIVRHVRVRPSENVESRLDASCIETSWNQHVMIDHTSLGWNTDDCLAGVNSDSITFQWNIISEGVYYPDDNNAPSKMSLWTPYDHDFFGGQGRVSYLHNYVVDYSTRAPLFAGGSANLVNNLYYNFQSSGFTYPLYADTPAAMEWINNYFRPGPDSPVNELGNPYPLVETVGCGRAFINCASAAASTLYMNGNLHIPSLLVVTS
jgi:hypothetical protein